MAEASTSTISPVFIKEKDIPNSAADRPSVLEMCLASERSSGTGSMLGAQNIRGLWRLYPASQQARTDLLVKGISIRNVRLQVANKNPFILRNETGEEKETTKVWIDNLPISVADSEVEHSLSKVGCELRSTIKTERARDKDGKLTRFLTGRRFVFISVPEKPLERELKISLFTTTIYHREQKLHKKPLTCSRCLEHGHHVSSCQNDVICRACKSAGHKRGDPACELQTVETSTPSTTIEHPRSKTPTPPIERDATEEREGQPRAQKQKQQTRGRINSRQTTLLPTMEVDRSPRLRSETPKRRRSRETASPGDSEAGREKQPRQEDADSRSRRSSPESTQATSMWG